MSQVEFYDEVAGLELKNQLIQQGRLESRLFLLILRVGGFLRSLVLFT